jgi:hypothetical protein
MSLNLRFSIQLDIRWSLRAARGTAPDNGTGRTLTVSSSEVSFESSRVLPIGELILLSLIWPVKLHDATPLQVVVSGVVVHSTETCTAVKIKHHEFRTMASKAMPPVGIWDGCQLAVSSKP